MSNEHENTQTKNRPTHTVKALRNPGSKNSYFEQLGVAFSREQGNGLYVKLTGSQVISDGLFIFPLGDMSPKSGAAQ